MQYMDMVINKGAFNVRYYNNATWIAFSINETVINAIIEVSAWSILATCLLSGKPLILSATLLNRYSDMIFLFFKKGIGLKLFRVPFSNCTGRGVKAPESYQQFFSSCIYDGITNNDLILILRFIANIFFNSGSTHSIFCGLRICTE